MLEFYITPAALAAAVYIDLRTRRIPNALTVTVAAVGIVMQGITGGWAGLLAGASGLAVGLALFVVPFVLGWIGGGDVKLMAAVGAVLGPERGLYAALYSAVAGGVIALLVLGWRALGRSLADRRGQASVPASPPWEETYPYALAIAAGTCVALLNPAEL